mgnify:CR=1 FL=1
MAQRRRSIVGGQGFYYLEQNDALGDLERVDAMLETVRYSPSFAGKLTAHLQRIAERNSYPLSCMIQGVRGCTVE